MILPVGKLDSELLKEIVFDSITFRRDDVLQRPGIGQDCAVVSVGDYECVLSTDPITGSVDDIGKLAVNITLNDIASNGVETTGMMLAVMLPYGTTDDDVRRIMEQAGKEAADHGIEIIGGHTEITDAVIRPVIVSTALGKCRAGESVNSDNIRTGDRILVSKEICLEGIGIISKEKEDVLKDVLTKEELEEAQSFIEKTSVVREGILAGKEKVSGMHDITEGGLLGAVWELCETTGLGAEIEFEKIPYSPVSEKICGIMGINMLRLISSGSMLITADPEKSRKLIAKAGEEGIKLTDIGRMTEGGRIITKNGTESEITPPVSDELYKALGYDR